jgi:hypothetical protein
MGLLDDAIREHLELKRRHGADAREIARQEREALGPVVRGELAIPDPGAPAALEEEPHHGGGVAVEHAEEDAFAPRTAETRFFGDSEPDAPAADVTAVDPPAAAAPPESPLDAGQSTVAFSLADLQAAEAAESAPPVDTPPTPAPEPATAAPAPAAPAQPQPPAPDERPRAAPTPLAATPPPADTSGQELSWDAPAADDAVEDPREVAEDVVPADQEPEEHDELEETPEFLQETPEHDRLWFEQRPPRDFDF